MKHALPAVAVLALSLAAAASAQSGSPSPASATGARTSPVTLPTPVHRAPEPIVIHSREYIGSREPGAQDPDAARKEAGAALAESRRQCAEQRTEDRKACLQQARERYDAALRALSK